MSSCTWFGKPTHRLIQIHTIAYNSVVNNCARMYGKKREVTKTVESDVNVKKKPDPSFWDVLFGETNTREKKAKK